MYILIRMIVVQARVNVRAIAQGSSERQIAVVCNAGDATRALRRCCIVIPPSPRVLHFIFIECVAVCV